MCLVCITRGITRSAKMEKSAVVLLTLSVLLPVVFGANPYRRDFDFCQQKESVCKMSSGYYGCCPAANGVCCADGDHCCPSGFTCDLSTKQCLQYGDPALYVLTEQILDVVGAEAAKGVAISRVKASNPLRGGVSNVDCPDGTYCDDGNTCCLGTNSQYTCCPLIDANCCDDYVHCCPSGTVCDTANGKCITPSQDGLDKIPFLVKPPANQQL